MSPIETQLRKVVPELCVNDVPERVAEVEMSSASPVRSDPLSDWLQPFDENLVDDEEQRVARVSSQKVIRTVLHAFVTHFKLNF